MHGILLIIHVILSILLILVILIQSGRSGGFSGLFGGGGGDALFSTASQQSGLRNATIVIAALFMMTSLGLTVLGSRRGINTVFNRALPAVPPVNLPPAQAPAPVEAMPQMPASDNKIPAAAPVAPKESKPVAPVSNKK